MSNQNQTQGKKKNHELAITLFFLFLISAMSAAFVIYFRYKMKPFQLKPEQVQEMENSEGTYDTQEPVIKK